MNSSHKITFLYGRGTKTTTAGELPPLKAIRAMCIDCSGGSFNEVKLCVISECPLYAYRFGNNPFRKARKLTEEQRQELAERLRRSRAR
jgi:hypothetical protein